MFVEFSLPLAWRAFPSFCQMALWGKATKVWSYDARDPTATGPKMPCAKHILFKLTHLGVLRVDFAPVRQTETQNRTEPNSTEQNRTGQYRTVPNSTVQNRTRAVPYRNVQNSKEQ